MMTSQPRWVDHYLHILQLFVEPPSLAFLRRIIHAHLTTFPFENISKVARYHLQPDVSPNLLFLPQKFLEEHERFGFGGTCFALNWHLRCLLCELGFDAYTIMLSGQHMGIIVQIPGLNNRKFYVDCGAAAPLFEPVDLESGGHHCACFGDDHVVIRHRISNVVHRFERYRNGVLCGDPWYFNTDNPQYLKDFLPVIRSSFEPDRPFMSSLRCHKFGRDLSYYVSLKNNRFQICYRDGRNYDHILTSTEEMIETIHHVFGIEPSFAEHAISQVRTCGINVFTYASSHA